MAAPVLLRRRDGDEGLKELVSDLGDIDAKEISSFPIKGSDIVIRVGRYGPYLDRDGVRVNIPEDIAPDELTAEKAEELFARPSGDRELGVDPETGRMIVAKDGPVRPVRHRDPARGRSRRASGKKRAKKADAPKPRTARCSSRCRWRRSRSRTR